MEKNETLLFVAAAFFGCAMGYFIGGMLFDKQIKAAERSAKICEHQYNTLYERYQSDSIALNNYQITIQSVLEKHPKASVEFMQTMKSLVIKNTNDGNQKVNNKKSR
jgi:hypothetical protein